MENQTPSKKATNVELNESMGIQERIKTLEGETDSDQEEPMTLDRKIHMLGKIFPLAIGDHVKNSIDEEGVIDLVGLDSRGVIYLVKYKQGVITWETDITKIPSHLASEPNAKTPEVKTDVSEEDLLKEEKKWEAMNIKGRK